MSSDAAKSKVEPLIAFQHLVEKQKAAEILRASIVTSINLNVTPLVRRATVTPESLAADSVALSQEISTAINTILGSDDGELGAVGDLVGTGAQGDYADRIRRATSLRHSSYARRSVQAATRRKSHGMPRGLIDRRVITPIVDSLLAAKQ